MADNLTINSDGRDKLDFDELQCSNDGFDSIDGADGSRDASDSDKNADYSENFGKFSEISEQCDTDSRQCEMGTPTLPRRPSGLKVFKLRKCSTLNSELSPMSQLVHYLGDTKIDATPDCAEHQEDANSDKGE